MWILVNRVHRFVFSSFFFLSPHYYYFCVVGHLFCMRRETFCDINGGDRRRLSGVMRTREAPTPRCALPHDVRTVGVCVCVCESVCAHAQ